MERTFYRPLPYVYDEEWRDDFDGELATKSVSYLPNDPEAPDDGDE
ncbi:hypothetical protein UFOVP158_35 [uncultured Caudovirales phage]|uniref:Uncharacterized protein n=1 Tax=uncultured Caudovirales phage TaxID=2100421 RepID=A0A6J7WCR0_9CAUD|nr:hypothetical protein UFOVP158_35 [uncultured Caudovirales phage]